MSKSFDLSFGVPQGSVDGTILYTLYTAPLEDIFIRHCVDFVLYADDSQLYMVCKKPSDVTNAIELCLEEIRCWMKSNLLILNPDKTEVVHFSSSHRLDVEKLDKLSVGTSDVTPASCIRNLGVYFDYNGENVNPSI